MVCLVDEERKLESMETWLIFIDIYSSLFKKSYSKTEYTRSLNKSVNERIASIGCQ